MSRFTRVLVTAVCAVVATALPAAAHPAFDPAEDVPRGTPVDLTLRMAHGCGPDETAPTIEVAARVPDAAFDVVPLPKRGWEAEVEEEGGTATLVWTLVDGAEEPAPSFELTATLAGDRGQTVYWEVFQSCGEAGEYRWIGTPDDPAEDPAVTLTLGRQAAPAPPATSPTMAPSPSPSAEAAPSPTPSPAATPSPETSTSGGAATNPLLWIAVLAVLAAGGYLAIRARR